MKVFKSILETIGNTPIVEINKISSGSIHRFFAKIEYFNPGGSVKDRVAINFIEEAEKRGELKPGGTIVEATSGNTGVGLALVAAVKGYKCIFVMPEKISEEKRAILRAHGAQVIITPGNVEPDDPRSFLMVAKTLAQMIPNSICTNQYHNPDNFNRHYKYTGPEIWEQMGPQIDVFVAGSGTGGTISGVGTYLKEKKNDIKVICADPVGSILADLYYHNKIIDPPQPYKVEGVGEDMLPDNTHLSIMDGFEKVSDKEAFEMTRRLTREEGLCVGPSSALALVGALKYSKKLKKPSNILMVFPDNGRGYLSKAFNDQWMIDNGFLESSVDPLRVSDLIDLIKSKKMIISLKSSLAEAYHSMKNENCRHLLVFDGDILMGTISEVDISFALLTGKLSTKDSVIHLLKSNFIYVEDHQTIREIRSHFDQNHLLVVKNNKTYFLLSEDDIVGYLVNGVR